MSTQEIAQAFTDLCKKGKSKEAGRRQEPVFERSSFIKPCSYCGARLAVFVSREVASGEEQTYECPECGKEYLVHAALEPLVSVLESRTDGKDDRYQETMF